MASLVTASGSAEPAETLSDRYRRVRSASLTLTAPLTVEDQVVQTMPEVSPTKWHLAHVTWFFERFCLLEHRPDYRARDERYLHLFNSYYYTVGDMFQRMDRGILSRPTVAEIHAYRAHVDECMIDLIAERAGDADFEKLVVLGLNHEQQHQELILTDIKQVLFINPLGPAYRNLPAPPPSHFKPLTFTDIPGGIEHIGFAGEGFSFDNETPRHRVLLEDHALGDRLVTNAEYAEFMADGGYGEPALWLADGWAKIHADGWNRPLCWSADLSREFTLGGWQDMDANAPVCHVSFYEADAFARWAGARLPSEAEWELAAARSEVGGNLLDSDQLRPLAASGRVQGITQLFGDVWEWTASGYNPYPGFEPLAGSLGEYNGKFMCNQMVVRGGSCATWSEHIRATYRSFFYPQDRWQFLGIRLARNT
ncbi:MAG: ergothioneine biosynthesis protein EgtB [Pseudomonadales bacterium]|nr:ergothioneine biosynthesis protein EgtB [Pseudomonadales bacterium]